MIKFLSGLTTLLILSASTKCTFSQNNTGFSALKQSKETIQGFAYVFFSIPPTSPAYKHNFSIMSSQYTEVKAAFEGFKEIIGDCIHFNASKRKMKKCLDQNSPLFRSEIEQLRTLTDSIYQQSLKYQPMGPGDTANNSMSAVSGKILFDAITSMCNALWDKVHKQRQLNRDELIKRLSDKSYTLMTFEELVNNYRSTSK